MAGAMTPGIMSNAVGMAEIASNAHVTAIRLPYLVALGATIVKILMRRSKSTQSAIVYHFKHLE